MSTSDNINDALDLTPFDTVFGGRRKNEVATRKDNPLSEPKQTQDNESVVDAQLFEDDYMYARDKLRETIESGSELLKGISDFASMSQTPGAYESAAKLIVALTKSNKDLLELSNKKRSALEKRVNSSSGDGGGNSNQASTVNQTLFVGDSAELLKLFKGKGEG